MLIKVETWLQVEHQISKGDSSGFNDNRDISYFDLDLVSNRSKIPIIIIETTALYTTTLQVYFSREIKVHVVLLARDCLAWRGVLLVSVHPWRPAHTHLRCHVALLRSQRHAACCWSVGALGPGYQSTSVRNE